MSNRQTNIFLKVFHMGKTWRQIMASIFFYTYFFLSREWICEYEAYFKINILSVIINVSKIFFSGSKCSQTYFTFLQSSFHFKHHILENIAHKILELRMRVNNNFKMEFSKISVRYWVDLLKFCSGYRSLHENYVTKRKNKDAPEEIFLESLKVQKVFFTLMGLLEKL